MIKSLSSYWENTACVGRQSAFRWGYLYLELASTIILWYLLYAYCQAKGGVDQTYMSEEGRSNYLRFIFIECVWLSREFMTNVTASHDSF